MNRFNFVLLFCALGLAAACAYFFGRAVGGGRNAPGTTSTPTYQFIGPLAVESSSLDLGEVWEEPEYIHTLLLHNLGGQEVHITKVATSCGCVSANPRSFSVPPGGETRLDLTLDLTHRNQSEQGLPVRPFSVEVYPMTQIPRDQGDPASWRIAGKVRSRVTLDKLTLNFENRPVFGQLAEPLGFTATVHIPAQGLKVTATKEGVIGNVKNTDPTASCFTVLLTPDTKNLEPGSFKTQVTVSVITLSGETLFGARLPVEGIVRQEVVFLPPRLIFGPRPVGETANGTLVLQDGDAKDLTFEKVEVDSPDVAITPTKVDGLPNTRAFLVKHRFSKPGEQSIKARFVFRKAGRSIPAIVIISSIGEVKACAGRPTIKEGGVNP